MMESTVTSTYLSSSLAMFVRTGALKARIERPKGRRSLLSPEHTLHHLMRTEKQSTEKGGLWMS